MTKKIKYIEYDMDGIAECINSLKLGDVLRVNKENKPYVITSLNPKFALLSNFQFGKQICRVLERTPHIEESYYKMIQGWYNYGIDDSIHGVAEGYHPEDENWCIEYLNRFCLPPKDSLHLSLHPHFGCCIEKLYLRERKNEKTE